MPDDFQGLLGVSPQPQAACVPGYFPPDQEFWTYAKPIARLVF